MFNSYLYTYDLYDPVRNVFDACRSITRASARGVWSLEIESFWVLQLLCWNLEQSMGARNRVGIGLSYRPASAGNLEQSMGARNLVGIGLSYQPAILHELAELIPWNRFRGSLKV